MNPTFLCIFYISRKTTLTFKKKKSCCINCYYFDSHPLNNGARISLQYHPKGQQIQRGYIETKSKL